MNVILILSTERSSLCEAIQKPNCRINQRGKKKNNRTEAKTKSKKEKRKQKQRLSKNGTGAETFI